MTTLANTVCIIADMNESLRAGRLPNPDDLLVLLAVSRHRHFTDAAEALGLNHTTVSRRISRLENDLGGKVLERSADGWQLTTLGQSVLPSAEEVERAVARIASTQAGGSSLSGVVRISATDGFSAFVVSAAVAQCRVRHPGIRVEVVTATRPAQQRRSGLDIEIVVGKPAAEPGEAALVSPYVLGLYASERYLRERGKPETLEELADHELVYFVDSMLNVDALGAPRRLRMDMQDALTSTNVFVQVHATRAGVGIGLLPCFMAEQHLDLVRILPDAVHERLEYWMVVHTEAQQQRSVTTVAEAIVKQARAMRPMLLGTQSRAQRAS